MRPYDISSRKKSFSNQESPLIVAVLDMVLGVTFKGYREAKAAQ
jgi:hypothetical protein